MKKKVGKGLRLYKDFHGEPPDRITQVRDRSMPDVVLAIGRVCGILYEAKRDGRMQTFLHRFRKGSRPLLATSLDGDRLILLGGAYRFTSRGIVDR